MRKSFLGLAGAAAALALGALTAGPAQAQGFSITIGTPGYYAPPPPPVYRAYPPYRPVYYRHAPRPYRPYYAPAYYEPQCTTRVTRHWDGWAWVTRRTRICD